MVDELKADTVALVHRDEDGDVSPFCAGVWVDKDTVLTADHCARAPIEALVTELLPSDGIDEDDEDAVKAFMAKREEMVQSLEDGFKIQYITDKESTGVWREPKALHVLKVIKHDKDHDLAVMKVDDAKDIPAHHVAGLAGAAPAVGEDVQVVGHPSGLTWTYVKGMVGAIREENFRPSKKKGPFIQIVGPVWKGNSGGGAYNEAGELVGIASFIAPAPNESFFVHIDSIKAFLAHR